MNPAFPVLSPVVKSLVYPLACIEYTCCGDFRISDEAGIFYASVVYIRDG